MKRYDGNAAIAMRNSGKRISGSAILNKGGDMEGQYNMPDGNIGEGWMEFGRLVFFVFSVEEAQRLQHRPLPRWML